MFLTLGLNLEVQVFVADSAFQGFGLKLWWFWCVLLNILHVVLHHIYYRYLKLLKCVSIIFIETFE